jgi:putative transposase
VVSVPERLEAVRHAQARGLSERRACALLSLSRSMLRYRHRRPVCDTPVITRMRQIARENPAWGMRLVFGRLREEGLCQNHKRAHRLWCREGLQQRRRRRRKRYTGARLDPPAVVANDVWCVDLTEDRLDNGQRFYALLVKDEASAYGLAIRLGRSFTAHAVRTVLAELVATHGAPRFLRSDNGPQFIAHTLKRFASKQAVTTAYIEPGKPWQNGGAESFVGTYRREVLDAESFQTLIEAKVMSERWRRKYNTYRPHTKHKLRPPATAYPFAKAA